MRKVSLGLGVVGVLLLLCGGYFIYSLFQSTDIVIQYQYIGNISENMLAVSDGKKFGYYDLEKKRLLLEYPVISQMKVDDNIDFSTFQYTDGVAPYTEGDKVGLIDSSGNVILDAQFDSLDVYSRNCIVVFQNYRYYLINDKNKKNIDDEYEDVVQIENSPLFILSNAKGTHLYDAKSKKILFVQLLDIQYLKAVDDDSYVISVTDRQNVVNNYYYQTKRDGLKELVGTEGLFPYEIQNDQIVFINDSGPVSIYSLSSNEVIKIKGDYLGFGTFNSDLSLVFNNRLDAGFVDLNEQLVIPYIYKDGTTNFNKNGIAIANDGINYGAIDVKNNVVIPFQYKNISFLDNNIYAVTDSNFLVSLYDLSLKQTISESYNFIDLSTVKSNLLVVQKENNKKKNLFGIIDVNGKEIIEPKYEDITIENGYILLKISKYKYMVYNIDEIY